MDTQAQVLQKLLELREALNQADAASQGGWMGKLYHDVEAAHTRAIGEAAIAQQVGNNG